MNTYQDKDGRFVSVAATDETGGGGDRKFRFYGDGGTIHGTTHVDIEVRDGHVVAVWFRCAALPFVETQVDAERALEMKRMYTDNPMPEVHGLQLCDADTSVVTNEGHGTAVVDDSDFAAAHV